MRSPRPQRQFTPPEINLTTPFTMEGEKAVKCPYCNSDETEVLALFGQQLLTMQYYCRGCRTPFEYVKAESS